MKRKKEKSQYYEVEKINRPFTRKRKIIGMILRDLHATS
jgi:hypothetical protein